MKLLYVSTRSPRSIDRFGLKYPVSNRQVRTGEQYSDVLWPGGGLPNFGLKDFINIDIASFSSVDKSRGLPIKGNVTFK